MWSINLPKEDIIQIYKDNFWREVLIAWCDYTYYNPRNLYQLKQQAIWGNSLIRIDNSPIFNYKAIELGFTKFSQMLDSNNRIKEYSVINAESAGCITFVQYYGICKSIPFFLETYTS